MASIFKIYQEGKVNELFTIYNHLTGKTGNESIGFNLDGTTKARISANAKEDILMETLSNVFEVTLTVPKGQEGTIDFSYVNLPILNTFDYDWKIPSELDFDFVSISTNGNELILFIRNDSSMPTVTYFAEISFKTTFSDNKDYTAHITVNRE